MSYRKHPTIPDAWQIYIRQGRKGKTLVFVEFGTEAEIVAMERQYNVQIKGAKYSVFPTIADALPDYLTYYRCIATGRIVDDFLSVMKRCLLPAFGRYQAHHIIPMMVYNYTEQRLQAGVTHRTIEKELAYLKAMCGWLWRNGRAEKQVSIPMPPKAKTAPRKVQQPLTADELVRLVESVPKEKRVLLLLMSDAGLRMSEALTLEQSSIDLAGLRITVKGKGGKVVVYPVLTARLAEAIQQSQDENKSQWLVCNGKTGLPYQSIKTLLRLASKRAGISKHVTHHTLRHTFSNMLMESGISTEVRRLLMRHSSLAATQHYTNISPEFLRKQAEEFSQLVGKV